METSLPIRCALALCLALLANRADASDAPADSASQSSAPPTVTGSEAGSVANAPESSDVASSPGTTPLWQRIDQLIAAYHHGPIVPVVSDIEFHKRIYLDLIGRIPTADETTRFMDVLASSPDSPESSRVREQLIDDLLSREEFSHHYARVLEVMFTERRPDSKISLLEFRSFIRQWLADRRPLNELCMEILAADGTGDKYRPAASFFLNRDAEPHLLTRDVGRIFFGRNVQCAQCHDHPLVADYEQSEYFGILSFVNRSFLFQDERRGMPFLGEKAAGELQFTSVFLPEDGTKAAEPVLPNAMAMDSEPTLVDDEDGYFVAPSKDDRAVPRQSRRQQLAVLATHPKNLSFNRNLANRLWAQMLGTGVVHPVDAHHSGNPPASSALLRALAEELVACQYDLRAMLKQIAMSQAYQRSPIDPNLENWTGPALGVDGLRSEMERCSTVAEQSKIRQRELDDQLKRANKAVQLAQADVAKVQTEINAHKLQLQQLAAEHKKLNTELSDQKTKQTAQKDLLASLQAAAAEAEKAAKLLPSDQELAASQTLFAQRTASITESLPQLEGAIGELQERVNDAQNRVNDQRSRIVALGSRRMALSEFVAEARGAQRIVKSEQLKLLDEISDAAVQQERCQQLLDYLELREQVRAAQAGDSASETFELTKQLEIAEQALLATWRRTYTLAQIRGLSLEQFASSTFYALQLDRPVRQKVEGEWNAQNANAAAASADAPPPTAANAANDPSALEKRIFTAVTEGAYQIEDHLLSRFAAPGGTPQDGFFATADQALLVQNDPTMQSWMQDAAGTLVHRLSQISSEDELVDAIYLSVLSRRPDLEERDQVSDYLAAAPDERPALLKELVWGLLASAEFRFMP